MASFGTNFDLQQFKAAYSTAEDMDAYNRVQAVERALGRVQNYVGELAEAGVKLAALPRSADGHGSADTDRVRGDARRQDHQRKALRPAGPGPERPHPHRAQLRADAGQRRASRGDPRAGRSSRLHRFLPRLDRAIPRRTRVVTDHGPVRDMMFPTGQFTRSSHGAPPLHATHTHRGGGDLARMTTLRAAAGSHLEGECRVTRSRFINGKRVAVMPLSSDPLRHRTRERLPAVARATSRSERSAGRPPAFRGQAARRVG